MAGRKKRGIAAYANRISLWAVVAIVVIIGVAASIRGIQLKAKDNYYARQEELLQAMIEEESQRQEELQEQSNYVQTKQYIEEIARTKLNLVYSDEYLFVNKEQ